MYPQSLWYGVYPRTDRGTKKIELSLAEALGDIRSAAKGAIMVRVWSRVIVEHPRLWAVFTILMTVMLGAGLRRLQFDIRPNAVFSAVNQVSRDLDDFHERFGPDDNDLLIMIEGEDLFELETLLRIRRLRDQLREINGIAHVASIFDLRQRGSTFFPLLPQEVGSRFDVQVYRDAVLRHPIAADQLISRDGEVLLLWARLDGESLSVTQVTGVVEPIRQLASQFKTETGLDIWLCGHPAIRAEVLTVVQRSMLISSVCALIMAGSVALLLFRGLIPTLVAILPPTIGAIWTFGAMAWSGHAVGGLTSALPSLIFVIGMTDSVHLLLHANRSFVAGHDRRPAAYRMLIRVGPACLLTSLTTMIGFGSLIFSQTESVQIFGTWSAVGAGLVLGADVVVLPTVIRFVPIRWLAKHDRNMGGWMLPVIERVTEPAVGNPRLAGLLGIALALFLLYPALSQQADIVWTETIPNNSQTTRAMARSDAKMGGSLLAYVMITWPEDRGFTDRELAKLTAEVQATLRDVPGFTAPFSVYNVLAGIPGRSLSDRYSEFRRAPSAMRQKLLNPAQRSLVISTRVPNDGAAALIERVETVERRLQQISRKHAGYRLTVTGTAVAAARNMNAIIVDLARSLGLASVMIFVVLTIAFRSLKIGMVSVIPNALPLLVTASGLSMLGFPLQITSALTFSMCLGLAVDDTIHVITGFRSLRKTGRSAGDSVRTAIRHVGPALVITTLILLAGFAAMEWTPMPGIRMFASLSCLTLLTALLGDLVLLPAMLLWIDDPR